MLDHDHVQLAGFVRNRRCIHIAGADQGRQHQGPTPSLASSPRHRRARGAGEPQGSTKYYTNTIGVTDTLAVIKTHRFSDQCQQVRTEPDT